MGDKTTKRLAQKPSSQRGVALMWLTMVIGILVLCTSLVIDMGWLYFRKEKLQQACDSAALAADWAQSQQEGTVAEVNLADQIFQSYGYPTTSTNPVVTPGSNGVANNCTVSYLSPETMFFAGQVTNNQHNMVASASATFNSYATMWTGSSYYGVASATPFVYCAYGPDQGDTRGDAINTRWNDVTGEYTKIPNPLNYNPTTHVPLDTGVTFIIQPAANYVNDLTALGINNTNLRVEIYDPETYVPTSAGTTKPVDQYVTTSGGTASPSQTPNEAWTYTLLAVSTSNPNATPATIATATFGETSANCNGVAPATFYLNWVTPPGFVFNVNTYPPSSYTYLLNIKTANPYVAGAVNALDKNGYLLRAGPDYSNSSFTTPITGNPMYLYPQVTDTHGDIVTTCTTAEDTAWSSHYGNNTTYGTLAMLGCENNLPLTAFENGSGQIALGTLAANPNITQPSIITVNGFDEDSGATGITYTVAGATGQPYNNTTFTGVLGYQATDGNGNGIWSDAGIQTRDYTQATTPSNTMYFAPGVYQGGTWTANYATGSEDTTTWNWTVNWNSNSGFGKPYLIYTSGNIS